MPAPGVMRPGYGLGVAAAVAVAVLSLTRAGRSAPPPPDPLVEAGYHETVGAAPGYVDDAACAGCHRDLYDAYGHVGMSRSFASARSAHWIEDFDRGHYYHAASDRHFEMSLDGGRPLFRSYQLDEGGQKRNVLEQRVDWVLGSGNRTRNYLYQNDVGELYQLPLGWYTQTREWAMAPGFDRRDHEGVLRPVRHECLFCHNAYPEVAARSDTPSAAQVFPHALPEGIGCQRCHGPGATHARLAFGGTASDETLRSAIVNPRRLTAIERDDVCLQCHLQPAVAVIGVRRFGRSVYSFRPGERLDDYLVHVDVEDASRPRDERFEINHHGYRLRQSLCFQKSGGALTCITCHDPHRKVPVKARAEHYRSVCLRCHEPHAPIADAAVAPGDCVSCHMPERRTQDVVHVVMTDHRIQRRAGGSERLAPLEEAEPAVDGLAFLQPERAPAGVLGDLYLATTLLRATTSAKAVSRLETLLPMTEPAPLEPYYDLAKAQMRLKRFAAAEKTVRFLLTQRPDDPLLWHWLGLVHAGQGRIAEGVDALRKALERAPGLPEAEFNLALLLSARDDDQGALTHLRAAVGGRPNLVAAWYYIGRLSRKRGRLDEASAALERALALDPSHSRSYLEWGEVRVAQGQQDEALRLLRHGAKVAGDREAVARALARLEGAARNSLAPPDAPRDNE
jgi:Flp pilus assembly protein TadD